MGKKTQTLEGHISGQANTPLSRPAHALPYSKVIEEIGCNPENGLTASEATKRHEQYGSNDLGEDGGVQPAKILLRQVANAMTLVSDMVSDEPSIYSDACIGFDPRNGRQLWYPIMD